MFSTSEMHTPVSSVSNQLQNGWNQQPPSCMQWGIMPLPNPRVTRFIGEQSINEDDKVGPELQQIMPWTGITGRNSEDNSSSHYFSPHKSFKRKNQESTDGQIRKQHITEDKISAHLSQLSLSSSAEKPKPELLTELENPSLIHNLTDDSKLVLSQELRRFQQESAIPSSLLESFARPTMAVVLWQPRNPVHDLLINRESSDEISRDVRPQEALADAIPMDDLPEDNNNEPMNNLNNLDQIMAGQRPAVFIDASDMDEDL